jgi:hypothetical protein
MLTAEIKAEYDAHYATVFATSTDEAILTRIDFLSWNVEALKYKNGGYRNELEDCQIELEYMIAEATKRGIYNDE